MLFGRGSERGAIDAMVDDARAGQSGVLVLSGEAGIGKTALLDYAAERAEGCRVLRAVGVESEAELAFSALHELLRPIQDRLEELPDRQAEALRSALALGPAAELERFAVAAATLTLLASVAEEQPLICLVDDAQWVDAASLDALRFSCRRLAAERVAVLFGARTGDAQTFDPATLPVLELGALHAEAAETLLARAHPDLDWTVAARTLEAAAGNPLALLELPEALADPQPAGAPLPTGPRLVEAFVRRARSLSSSAQRALEVAAAGDSAGAAEIGAALRVRGLDPRLLEEAEEAGLLELSADAIVFRHPLVRSAVYHAAAAGDRRAAHAALAEAVAASPERRAAHLAAAAVGPDETVAAALEEAARSAGRRGGIEAVARTLERAAHLTPDSSSRSRRLVAAARAVRTAGRAEAAEALLGEALREQLDEPTWAEAQVVRADILYWRGDAVGVMAIAAETARIERIDPVKAAAVLGLAAMARMPDELDEALVLARRAHVLDPSNLDLQMIEANALFRLGRSQEAATVLAPLAGAARERAEWDAATDIAVSLSALERYDEAQALVTEAADELRAAGALRQYAHALCAQTQVTTRRGDLAAAYVAGTASLRLSDEVAEPLQIAFAASFLSACEALLGLEPDVRAHAAAAIDATGGQERVRTTLEARAALGLLELQLGRGDAAIAQLERVHATLAEVGVEDPGYVQAMPELVEAYARGGRVEDAERVLETLERQARATDRIWALAAAARCRGILGADAELDRHFQEALTLHTRAQRPLEQARTELWYGERLRRAGRRTDSREPLRAALETFERAGARLYADRARNELAATGERIRAGPAAREELTPQELQVTLKVASGATNKEAGAELFLSPKTIEFHLRNAYRKLGVTSRTQLANVLRQGEAER